MKMGWIEKFLDCDEINLDLISRHPHKAEAISIKKTNFSWGGLKESDEEKEEREKREKDLKEGKITEEEMKKAEKSTTKTINDIINLKDIELKVRKGELLMVVGKVGSGKTSLLSAIQGEMLDIKSEVLDTIWDKPST